MSCAFGVCVLVLVTEEQSPLSVCNPAVLVAFAIPGAVSALDIREAPWLWDLCQVLVSVEMGVKLGTVLLPGKAEMQLVLGTEIC